MVLGKVVGMNILERVLRIELHDPQRVLEYTLEEISNHADKSSTMVRAMR